MALSNLNVIHHAQLEQTTGPSLDVGLFNDERTSPSSIISLGASMLELSYGTGGVVSLDPDHEDAKRYPNPKRTQDTPPPQDQPPQDNRPPRD